MKFKYVEKPHYVCQAEFDRVPHAKAFFDGMLDPQPFALILTDGGKLVGFLRYDITGSKTTGQTLWPSGTWVHPDYQKQGLAAELWRRVINKIEPKRVIVRTISQGGRSLVANVMKEFLNTEFEVLRP